MDAETIITVCTTAVAIIGLGVGYIKNKKAKSLAEAGSAYLEGLAAYERGFADKNLTDSELIEVGKYASKHYAALKGVFLEEEQV